MKTNWKKFTVLALGVLTAAALLGGCGSDNKAAGSAADGKTVVKTVISGTEAPLSWVDEKGEKHGYEYDVLLEVNKRLKNYRLDIQAVPPETEDVMMESGDAKVATGGYFKNAQREQNFLLPESPIGASSLMVYVTKGNETKYKNLEELLKDGKKIVPLTANGGAFRIITEWNKKHGNILPEIPVQSGVSVAERIKSIKEGQYDAYIIPNNLGVEDLAAKQGVTLVALPEPIKVNATYVLVNKKEDKLAGEINEALKSLRDDGTLAKISTKWYKDDLLKLLK
ncbi:transporter substrate-binding domain-containing protein [uncultured Phascolarctobacterium sp.]|uniref:transporter substrate-binding domain-containing protein n=1 Tax=uncultured Phascolarctobacterium sp. TaxID=512296 RepID=UPI0027DCE746|nr:transporter substrate-binding domain-containing protein [uncultured Phascolarctobacterium sp.]